MHIIGIGGYLPNHYLTNDDLSKIVNTNDGWIRERTGITKRHIALPAETTSDLAFKASQDAINKAKLTVHSIDLIIVATSTPDANFPSTASILQHKLGITHAIAFDVSAACSGFLQALQMANLYLKAGISKNALIVGAEVFSRIMDWQDRNTCVLFGDGAGAFVLTNSPDDKKGFLDFDIQSNGNIDILKHNGSFINNKCNPTIQMKGQDLFKFAVDHLQNSIHSLLSKHQLNNQAIDLFVMHQANARMIDYIGKKLGLSKEKILMTVDEHANTSAASIPLALWRYSSEQSISNKMIVFSAIGAGTVWGSALYQS